MKKMIVVALSVILVMSALCLSPSGSAGANTWDGVSVSNSLGGSGTAADPYLITSGADLALLRREINAGNALYSSAYYKQTADIDLNRFTVEPIGLTNSAGAFFCGEYNGDGYKILNYVVNTDAKYAGLFGYVEGAYFDKLRVDNASVSSCSGESSSAVGVMIGYINTNTSVEGCETGANCYAESINVARVGGLIGWNYSSIIKNCINRATVVYSGSSTTYAGGITSTLGKDGGLIESCINIGTVLCQSGSSKNKILIGGVSGLVGGSSGSCEVKDCYNMGTIANLCDISATDVGVGGITGNNNKGQAKLYDCYNVGAVYTSSGQYNAGKNHVGSVFGYTTEGKPDTSTCCYSLTQTGVPAQGAGSIDSISLVGSLTDTVTKSTGGSVKFSDALAEVDAAVANALGVVCDWSKTSYNLESAEVEISIATVFQQDHIAIIENAPNEGEAKSDDTTAPTTTDAGQTEPDTTSPSTGDTANNTEPTTEPGTNSPSTGDNADDVTGGETTDSGGKSGKGCRSSFGAGAGLAVALVAAARAVTRRRRYGLK